MNHLELGKKGESLTINYLKENGFIILEQNYKKFFGEIDIIAQKNDLVVFVEVKTRKQSPYSIFETITPQKQKKIITVAQHYIAQQCNNSHTYRFDVSFVQQHNKETNITYIPNAFNKKEM